MSENLTPETFQQSPMLQDITPSQAVGEYLQIGPMVQMGTIPVDQLAAWGTVLTNNYTKLTAEQHYHAGSIRIEEAYTHGQQEEPPVEVIKPLLGMARDHLGAVSEKTGHDRVLGAYALASKTGVTLYEAIACDDPDLFPEGWYELYGGQLSAARLLLRHFERFKNISDIPGIHSAVVGTMVSMFSEEGIFCLPAPSRATLAAHEAKNAWSLLFWHPETDRMTRARIAATGEQGLCLIPPYLLENSTYPSPHGQGLLQALIDFHGIAEPVPGTKLTGKQKIIYQRRQVRQAAARDHLLAIREQLMGHIVYFFEHGTNEDQPQQEMGDATQAYVQTDPHLHPSKMDRAVLEAAISELTTAALSDELTTQQNRLLAWMRVEMGILLAGGGDTSASLHGEFDEAQDILAGVAVSYRHEDDADAERQAGLEAEAELGRIFTSVYKGVALDETGTVNMEEIRLDANNELVDVATEMLEEFGNITDMSSKRAIELYQALQLITACLTINILSDGAHVAAVSTPRQRGEAEGYQKGWDITVWPMSTTGSFMPDYYGRLRLADKDNVASVDENVLTVAGRRIDNDNSFANLRNLIKMADGRAKEVKPKGHDRLAKLHKYLTSVADAAEW